MLDVLSSLIMRTTLDLEKPVLAELKAFGRREGRSLGQAASQLLAEALADRGRQVKPAEKFHWISRPMKARVDLSDKEAVFAALDEK